MVLNGVCAPAMIYFVFSLVQIIIDVGTSMYNTALMKLVVAFIITLLLNILCQRGLGIVSWLIVFIPFILTSIIITILLFVFGLKPSAGKVTINYPKGHESSKSKITHSNFNQDFHDIDHQIKNDAQQIVHTDDSKTPSATCTKPSSDTKHSSDKHSSDKHCPNGCVPPMTSNKSCKDVMVSGKKQSLCPYECIGGADSDCKGNDHLCSECGDILISNSATH